MNTRLMIEGTKCNKANESTVYVEVSVNNRGEKKKTIRIPTKIKVNVDNWSPQSQSIKRGKTQDYYKINQMLIAQREIVKEIIAELELKGKFQLQEIKQIYNQKTSIVTKDFFEIYDGFLAIKELSLSRNGVKDFKTLRKHLVDFENHRKRKFVLSEIDQSFFEEFEIYLSTLKIIQKTKDGDVLKSKLFADSTILKNLQTLRVFLNSQHDKGLPINLSYKKYKIRAKPSVALITLEDSEYRLLLNDIENNPRLENVRKLFVLQCSTGLRYSDAIKIRKNHIRNETIYLNSTKTKQRLQIPLNAISKKILFECDYDTSTIAISNQKFNDYIKELCQFVGINQPIMKIGYRGNKETQEPLEKFQIMSSHHGRRFFVTQNLLNGIRPEVIMSMTGHLDFRSFQKYIAVTDQTRINAMDIWTKTFN